MYKKHYYLFYIKYYNNSELESGSITQEAIDKLSAFNVTSL